MPAGGLGHAQHGAELLVEGLQPGGKVVPRGALCPFPRQQQLGLKTSFVGGTVRTEVNQQILQ